MSSDAAPQTVLDFLRLTTGFFEGKGLDTARLDAELLLAETLGLTRMQIYTSYDRPLAKPEIDRFREFVRRRAAREPVAYILGRREFWSLDFAVDRRVLIPRPETELIVERAAELLRPLCSAGAALRVADVGTGSGAIAIALAVELPSVRVWATDLSESALEIAPGNAARHEVSSRIEFLRGDFLEPLSDCGPFDLLVSNPPYVTTEEFAELETDVKDWEPVLALTSGADGLDASRVIIGGAAQLLVPDGTVMLEVGTQAAGVRDLFEEGSWRNIRILKDLAGRDRVVAAQRPQ